MMCTFDLGGLRWSIELGVIGVCTIVIRSFMLIIIATFIMVVCQRSLVNVGLMIGRYVLSLGWRHRTPPLLYARWRDPPVHGGGEPKTTIVAADIVQPQQLTQM